MDVTRNVIDTLSFDDKVYRVHPGTWQFDLSCSVGGRLDIEKADVLYLSGVGGGGSDGIVISALGCL